MPPIHLKRGEIDCEQHEHLALEVADIEQAVLRREHALWPTFGLQTALELHDTAVIMDALGHDLS